MMQASVYGRLGSDPRQHETKSGKLMTTVSIAVNVTSGNGDESETLWLGVLAFGKTADNLLRHEKGDLISLSGRIQQNCWINSEGVESVKLEIIVDSLVSAKTVRPGGVKNTKPNKPVQSQNNFYDDEIPF